MPRRAVAAAAGRAAFFIGKRAGGRVGAVSGVGVAGGAGNTGLTKYLIEVMEYLGDVIRDMGESLETLPEQAGETLEERILGIVRRFRERREPPEEGAN